MTPTRTVSTVLDTGLHWLYETVQPDDAHQQHHGITLGLPEANRRYEFCPAGARRLPVVSVTVARVDYGPNDLLSTPANPIEPGELEALAAELERRGFPIDDTWNGHPGGTGSVGLRQAAHPTLIAAVDRYRAGCSRHPRRSVFCDCEAWRAEAARSVQPVPAPAV